MAPKAVDVVSGYFEGADLAEGVEMTILDGDRTRRFPICICDGNPGADRIITELQERLPPVEQGPMGLFGDRYPQFRKIFVFCIKPETT